MRRHIMSKATEHDPVRHPLHYCDGKIEVIDYIEDKKLGFHLGNAVKYISRAGKKDPSKEIEDLEKAVWYINRYIAKKQFGGLKDNAENQN
jgi:CRISPR/Cas system-associated protein Cas5 (RAMP superfamily)